MATITLRSLIGKGPTFPFNLSSSHGTESNAELERINQSLYLLFSTSKGSRLMLPEYGSSINEYRFDPLDTVLIKKLEYALRSDIEKWEPRIMIDVIDFLTEAEYINNSILYIQISYHLINTPISGNYVYPYRLESYDTEKMSL